MGEAKKRGTLEYRTHLALLKKEDDKINRAMTILGGTSETLDNIAKEQDSLERDIDKVEKKLPLITVDLNTKKIPVLGAFGRKSNMKKKPKDRTNILSNPIPIVDIIKNKSLQHPNSPSKIAEFKQNTKRKNKINRRIKRSA